MKPRARTCLTVSCPRIRKSILESDSLPPAEELAPGMANTMLFAMARPTQQIEGSCL